MISLSLIVEYKHVFDDKPKDVESYLQDIPRDDLMKIGIALCAYSTKLEPTIENVFYPFLEESDRNTKYEENLKSKVKEFINKTNQIPCVVNVRSSLRFFELVQKINICETKNLSEGDLRKRVLKAYLILNKVYGNNYLDRENVNEMLIAQALTQSIYSNVNCYYLRIVELIKSKLFLEFCDEYIPTHVKKFIHAFGLDSWFEYVLYVHEIGSLIINNDLNNPIPSFHLLNDQPEYEKKRNFLEKFSLLEIYQTDQDFTQIKSRPIIKDGDKDSYLIIFEQFLIEKMYKGLYFILKEINDTLKGEDDYIKPNKFRSDIGLLFSEKKLLNIIIKDSIGKKYKHLGYDELTRKGCSDYYIRDGKNVFLFECKDNFVKKEIIETADVDSFIEEMKHIFVENDNGKPKAIKQLINNIEDIRNCRFVEDNGLDPCKSVIYPIIVTNNTLFSLSGVNMLIDEWFSSELEERGLCKSNIKKVTLININTLILLQDLLAINKYNLRRLINSYWNQHEKFDKKVFSNDISRIIYLFEVSLSFDNYIEKNVLAKNLFLKKFEKYFQ